MSVTMPAPEFTRSFPELREFLLKEVVGPDYPVKHLIEQARNKGHITKGKRGRGGGVVTSRDTAMLLIGTLAGDTPQSSSDAMGGIAQLKPSGGTNDLTFRGLEHGWRNHSFVDTVALLIDAWRHDFHFGFLDMSITVTREPRMSAQLIWNDIPYERDEHVSYSIPIKDKPVAAVTSRRRLSASYGGEVFRMAADWLEGREGYP